MQRQVLTAATVVALELGLLVVASPARAAQNAADVAAICGRCHERPVTRALETGGHAAGVLCTDCHRNRRPGRFGRGHRTIMSCAKHHEPKGHPKRRARRSEGRKRKLIRNCTRCHDQHGSRNSSLVRETIRARRRRSIAVGFNTEVGTGMDGFADTSEPGKGLCEICHRKTAFYRRDGSGQAHFTVSCVLCHKHEERFGAIFSADDCEGCHVDTASLFTNENLHTANLSCRDCHDQLLPSPGPGHRRVPGCIRCHTDGTHGPSGTGALTCTACHDPHGTGNIRLIRDRVTTAQGETLSIEFGESRRFVSTSEPGSGICEVCHTATRFFRNDGSGDPHASFSCPTCHEHGERVLSGTHPAVNDATFECTLCHSEENCSVCHSTEADLLEKSSLHQENFPSCRGCHEELSPSLGPDHRRVPDCSDSDCHSPAEHASHAPPGAEPLLCTRCHGPHGTDNIRLIRDRVTTAQGETLSIEFGESRSFVSPSEPGSGICEVCHTATRFFRNDGSGDLHADFSCPTCHEHADGFVEGTHVGAGDQSFPCTLCHDPPHASGGS